MTKHFEQRSDAALTNEEAMALRFSNLMGLELLTKWINGSKGLSLEVFLSVKTHKEGEPFRAIVSERGTWQLHVGEFLKKRLSSLILDDRFCVRKSEEVAGFFSSNAETRLHTLSRDMVDLYYSLQHTEIMTAVRDSSGKQTVDSQNASGISSNNFLELVAFYLKSMLVVYEGNTFSQEEGGCIESGVAPFPSDICLSYIDQTIHVELQGSETCRVFRYVNDLLIVNDKQNEGTADRIRNMFSRPGKGLQFTVEVPTNDALQFLDLNLRFDQDHV